MSRQRIVGTVAVAAVAVMVGLGGCAYFQGEHVRKGKDL